MELKNIQQKLKVPKSEYNSFGKYNYRTTEIILEELNFLNIFLLYHINKDWHPRGSGGWVESNLECQHFKL